MTPTPTPIPFPTNQPTLDPTTAGILYNACAQVTVAPDDMTQGYCVALTLPNKGTATVTILFFGAMVIVAGWKFVKRILI